MPHLRTYIYIYISIHCQRCLKQKTYGMESIILRVVQNNDLQKSSDFIQNPYEPIKWNNAMQLITLLFFVVAWTSYGSNNKPVTGKFYNLWIFHSCQKVYTKTWAQLQSKVYDINNSVKILTLITKVLIPYNLTHCFPPLEDNTNLNLSSQTCIGKSKLPCTHGLLKS